MSAILAAVALWGVAEPALAQVWEIQTVDTEGVGRFASLKADSLGNGHVAYVADDGQYTLKYGFWDHALKRWFTMPLATGAAFSSLALDSKNRAHISWADAGTAKGAKLRYASWDGKQWQKTAVPLSSDVIGYYTGIALDKDDNPILSFYEYEGPGGIGFVLRLRTVTRRDGYWQARTVDQTPGSGKFNSLATDAFGRPSVAYANVKAEYASLRFAAFDGNVWKPQVLEGGANPLYVYSVALAVAKDGTPHIAYADISNHLMKYATLRGGQWHLQAIDGLTKEAYPDRNGVAVDENGEPWISYYDAALGVLKLAHRESGKWAIEIVDRNSSGFASSLQIAGGMVWLAYGDEGGNVFKMARRPLRADTSPALAAGETGSRSMASQ